MARRDPGLARLAAFTTDPAGGNPAGVWVGEELPAPDEMQRIAADVGYSETAFVAPTSGADRVIRYYSPAAEVPFCGHATIATGVVLGERDGEATYRLATRAGEVPLTVTRRDGRLEASLTSVEPTHRVPSGPLLTGALAALRWRADELDPTIPPAVAYAGAWHLVLAAGTRDRLRALDYDVETLKALMLADDLTTLQLVWREDTAVFHARDPFPVGGVVEDAATGAAAAALGGYLRDAGLVDAPASILIRQGEDMGRPSRLRVEIPTRGGIIVSGTAVTIPD